MTDWLNNWLGRKRVIFWTCAVSAITCLLQAFAPTGERGWHYLFAMRFLLGLGIGPKSATAVSYTHLDVYKRQSLDRVEPVGQSRGSPARKVGPDRRGNRGVDVGFSRFGTTALRFRVV